MIRLVITSAAFDAIAATLSLGSVAYQHERTASGGYSIWLDQATVDKLEALRGPFEDTVAWYGRHERSRARIGEASLCA